MAPRLSPSARTSAVTIPRQLAPTVGPAHGGFEFLKGIFEGLKGYTVGRMTKSHRSKLYIDDAGGAPEAGSIEYGYRVPFGGIHVFIGRISESGPEPDVHTNLIEIAQRAKITRVQSVVKHALRPAGPGRVAHAEPSRRDRRRDPAQGPAHQSCQ